uniref:Pseudouridylate synthase RPUSD4, mitochondrial n=2 Tax=Tetranychus urticae TaxID=32264 RepID=T1L0C7_TETUR
MKKNSQNDESQDSPENKEIKTEDHNNLTSEEVEDVPKTALDYITQIRKGQLLPEDKAYLEHLEKKFKKLVHRLDRDATGVLLLAKSLSMVKTLREMFSERKISKYYWAIVRGIPDPLNGIIDIPIEAGKTNGVERMHLKPDCDLDFNRKIGATRGAYPATTHFRTLRKWGNACLVELKPEQGIKHQIRVHLGFGLRTPILGDHKYSHLDKLAPQKLPDDMLLKLNVRQAKVRNIPLHLHSKLYIIPGIGMNGNNVSISAHLPGFFRANMSSLGLYKQEAVLKNPIAF